LRTEVTKDQGPKWLDHCGSQDRSVHQRTEVHITQPVSSVPT